MLQEILRDRCKEGGMHRDSFYGTTVYTWIAFCVSEANYVLQ